MVASPSGHSSRSSKTNPCSVCGRDTDGDCELKPDGRVFCNRGSNFAPPPEARNEGDVVPGADGQQWAYLGDTELGRAMFKPDEGKSKSKTHLRVVSAPSRPLLARLPDGANLPDLNREKATYVYGPKQETRRAPDGKGGKTIRPWHLKGRQWDCISGPDQWPLYQQDLALQADGWLIELEGERCVGIAMAAGLVAISQPGHNHTAEAITARYAALVAAGSKVFYIEDNDAEGIKKGARIRNCAAAAGLQLLSINAADVWPGIAEKGSIDDAPGTAVEQVAALEAALLRAQSKARPQEPEQEHPSSYSKPLTMATHAVLIQLPQRIGAPRLNIRTRDVHLPDRIISGDEASRLYLQLSSDREKWPKETTFDAVQLLAEQASFDPVAEYLDGLTASTEPLPLEEWQRLDLLLFNIDDPVAAAFLPRFFITAVARTFKPGCIGRQWPVLIGEKGIGKSDLPKLLFNIPGLPDGFVDNPGDLQRDGLMKSHRSWCVELAELNGISRRADKEHLKAFLSERVDTYRAPYSRAPAAHPRRHVFWGTSNGPPMNEADPRLVCIPLPDRMLPFAAVEAAKDSLWARAVQQYRLGTCWHTVGDDFKALLKERNEDHTVTDPWADQVARNLEFRHHAGSLPVSIPELMDVLTLDSNQRNNSVAVRLIELAGSLGWVKAKRRPAPGLPQKQGLWPKDWK